MLQALLLCLLLGLLVTTMGNLWVIYATRARVYADWQLLPVNDVGLVLGTSKVLGNGQSNLYFRHRMQAAAALFHAGKVRHLLVSGDHHTSSYNEPQDMKESLLAQGVPAEAITLDYAGFRTLDSIVRAKEVFGQQRFTIISQEFHNYRALFISRAHGIEAVAYCAHDVPWIENLKTRWREYQARLKMLLDLFIFRKGPKFLGDKVEIRLTFSH